MTERIIKLLAIMEARSVTGPAKNLFEFCRVAGSGESAAIQTALVTFDRAREKGLDAGKGVPEPDNGFAAAASQYGIELHSIEERFRFDPQVFSALHQIVERVSPNIIQTHGVKSHFLVRLSGLSQRYPWVAFHHGYTATDAKMRAYNQLDRWSLRAARKVVTVSQAMAADLAHRGVPPDKILVVHNSVGAADLLALNEGAASNEQWRDSARRVILSVGRLSREKGHIDLISAMALLKSADRDSKLILVGDGPERVALEQAVDRFDLFDRVTFTGQVNDVRPYYKMADVVALPSYSEGSPNVVLEAMAAGVPIVATKVGGVPEILQDGANSLLVAPHDPRAMAKALSCVLTDHSLSARLADNASRTVTANHSSETRARLLIGMYESLTA